MDTWGQSAGKKVAWLAGMIDADGCIGLHRQPYKGKVHYVPDLSISTSCSRTREVIISLLHELEIGCHVTARKARDHDNWSVVWVIDVRGMKRVAKLARFIGDDLVTKKAELSEVVKFIELRQSQPKSVPYGQRENALKEQIHWLKLNRNASLPSETLRSALNIVG